MMTPQAQRESVHAGPHGTVMKSAKARAIDQWTAIPCGSTATAAEPGTIEFFAEVRRHRYADAPWMLESLGFRDHAGARVLEVGVGLGTDHCEWLDGGARAVGIDLTPRHIELAAAHVRATGHEPILARSDAENLPFKDAAFDLVYSFGVLHHTPGTERAIDEVWRVLRPGGRGIVMLYHRDSENYWLNMMLRHGLLRGELLQASPSEILSRWAESSDSSARPLVKVYSRSQARELFRQFSAVDVSVYQLTAAARRALRLLGRRIGRWVENRVGWNLIIDAVK